MKNPNRVAAGRRSNRKGGAYERQLAKKLKEWWGSGEWARTPRSGGWATREVREGFRTCGDIITTAEDFPFCVEAKNEKDWKLDQLLTAPRSRLYKFWEQAMEESPPSLYPLVIARNGNSEFVLGDPRILAQPAMANGTQHLLLRAAQHDLCVLRLKEFLAMSTHLFLPPFLYRRDYFQ